jgi:predicted AlkP superfamily phosphohydrolase/phosphomutase
VSSNRLFFIGLDAGDADLIEQWVAEGHLPNIARLGAEGVYGRLRTTAEVFHVSAWPSIFTGTTADKHGLYHAYVTRPGHQGVLRPRPDETPFPFVWKILSERQKRSIVIDAFLTCPLQPFNGVQMVDWGSWSHFWDPTISPKPLAREVRRRFGAYPADDHSKVGITPVTDIAEFRRRLLAGVETKTALVKWLLSSQPWDFFLVVFGESHPAGHYFWHCHDESFLTHPPDVGRDQHALRDVYVALDLAIGELVAAVGPDTTVMLVSGDGMAANYSGSHLLNNLLTTMGEMNRGGSTVADAGPPASGPNRRDLLSTVRNMVPEGFRNAVSQALLSRRMQEQLSLRWKTAAISWPRTRAFVIENANEGYIRVNLRGREPEGIVSPGAEYNALRDELCRTARAMKVPATGKPAALAVYKTDDICHGPRRDHMPDVVITWNLDARVTTEILTDKYGLVRMPLANCQMAPFYTGNHWPSAFMAAVGPGVPAGGTVDDRSILDLAPTVLRHFGIEPPAAMDGRPLTPWHRTTRDSR